MTASIGRILRTAAGSAAAFGLWMSVSCLASACSDDTGETTAGHRIALRTRAELAGEPRFENAFGWDIELKEVTVSVGALHYFSGSPIEGEEASIVPVAPRPSLLGWLAPASAHAHPGHYKEGDARGEMLVPTNIELALGPVDLPAGEGITGVVRSGRFTWGEPPSDLDGALVVVEGTATKGELHKVFRLRGERADVLDSSDEPEVVGCVFHEVEMESDGVVTLRVDPRVWLDQAEFDTVPDSEDDEPVDVPEDDLAARAFVRGLKKSSAFTFSYEPTGA